MNTAIWGNLIWKEWREQRWKLVALVAVVVGLHVWALDATEPGYGHYADPLIISHSIVLPIGSILLAVGLAAGERSARTAPFLRSLPLDLRKIAVVKLAMSVVVIFLTQALAILLTCGLLALVKSSGWAHHSSSVKAIEEFYGAMEASPWGFKAFAISTLVGASLVLWIAAVAVNSLSEVRAGAIGLVVFVGLWAMLFGVIYLTIEQLNRDPGSWYEQVIMHITAALPGGIWPALGNSQRQGIHYLTLLTAFLLTHVPLAWWYITRFGQTNDLTGLSPRDASPQQSEATAWLGPPMRSPLYALCWKQLRQGASVALAGGVCAVVVTIVIQLNSYQGSRGLTESEQLFVYWGASAVWSFMILGCCAGLVGGAGALTTELEPRLFTFWRTRPIQPDLWFWTTFASGLALLLLVFGTPVLLAERIVERLTYEQFPEPLLPILAASYVAGAFAAAILRHAVYASFLGIGVLFAMMVLAKSDVTSLPEWLFGPAVLLMSAALALLAWLAVRNDWSLRLS